MKACAECGTAFTPACNRAMTCGDECARSRKTKKQHGRRAAAVQTASPEIARPEIPAEANRGADRYARLPNWKRQLCEAADRREKKNNDIRLENGEPVQCWDRIMGRAS